LNACDSAPDLYPNTAQNSRTQETRAVNKASEPIKPKIACCIALAGSVPAGVLLYRILFWSKGNGIERDGHKWVTLPNERWRFETSLTPKQLRTAFEQLAGKGIIVRQHYPLEHRSFIRLSDTA
jgi:hypothetical protein